MKKYCLIALSLLMTGMIWAQAPAEQHHPNKQEPKRTPEMIATKQTERMVRELNITDSVQRQQLYDFHLRFAQSRPDTLTRRLNLERMQAMTTELQTILTKEQYDAFMDKQIDPQAQRHHPIAPMRKNDGMQRPPQGGPSNRPLPPIEHPE